MQLITILGQTSSGKSDLAIALAHHLILNGTNVCIVSCDSRQIYRGLNVGTGKVEGSWQQYQDLNKEVFVFDNVAHFMIDCVDPKLDYNLQNYVSDFYILMNSIKDQFEYVILVGGTGLYAKSIVEQINLGSIKSDYLLDYQNYKTKLQAQDLQSLQRKLAKSNIQLNNSDYNNKIRLVSNLLKIHSQKNNWLESSQYFDFDKQCLFAISIDQNELKNKIESRLRHRFNQGLLNEIEQFKYLGKDKFMALGLEYKQGWLYLNGEISEQELQTKLLTENLQYAKRQMTWLKKQKNLIWIRNLADILDNLK